MPTPLKISDMGAVTSVLDTDTFPFIRGSDNDKATLSQMLRSVRKTFDVVDYGADPTGLTDSTAAILLAIAAIPAAGGTLLFPPGGVFKSKRLDIVSKSNLLVTGPGAIIAWTGNVNDPGMTFGGSGDNIEVYDLRFRGSGVVSDNHQGVTTTSPSSYSNFKVVGCHFENLILGIYFGSDTTDDTHDGFVAEQNYLDTIVGTASGAGYGIATSRATNCKVIGNHISAAQRHSIYLSQGRGHVVLGNTIKNHRIAVADTGFREALIIARCQSVSAGHNTFDNCFDGCVAIEPDVNANQQVQNIDVSNNVFSNSRLPHAIRIGSLDPTLSGLKQTADVTISGNSFFSTGIDTRAIRASHCERLHVHDNHITALAIPNGTALQAMTLEALGETAGTSTYSKDWTFKDNTFFGVLAGSGSMAMMRFQTPACQSSVAMKFSGNKALAGATFEVPVNVDDPNITIVSQAVDGLNFSPGVGPVSETGPGVFTTIRVDSGAGDANSGIRIVAPISTTHFNWMLAANQNVNRTLEITPSTVVGGTTFTKPGIAIHADGAVYSGMDVMAYSPIIALNTDAPNFHKVTTVHATGNATINANTGGNAGQHMWILVVNDATSGKTITWGSGFRPINPTFTGTPNKAAQFHFTSDGSSWFQVGPEATGL